MRRVIIHAVFVLALMAGCASTVLAGPFTLTTIAVTDGTFASFDQAPSINDRGIVVFGADLSTGARGIFAGGGAGITTIADTSGPFAGFPSVIFGSRPTINDSGTVAFLALLDKGPIGIFTGDGGPTATIVDSDGAFDAFGLASSINNDGTVAFTAFLDDGSQGIFTASGGSRTTIADVSGQFQGGFGNSLSINDGGTVAFKAFLDTGGGGIFSGNGERITTIADTSGPFISALFSEPSINSQGTVAFSGVLDTFTTGIFAGNGDALAVLIGAGGPLGFFGQPSINDSGTVAFEAFARGRGVFTGPDPVADKVIAFGDTLLGSTVSDVRLSPRGLNNSGEIAFYAELADGTQGIFRATPVPEPGSPLLLGCVLAGLVAWRPRKKRSIAFPAQR